MHKNFWRSLFLGGGVGLLVALALAGLHPIQAQAGSPAALIEAVNAYRSANGLAPYEVDGGLMSLAQGQSEYMASIQACTHQRADGSGPGDHGISAENVACGPNLSVEGAIFSQWTDPLHSATLLGPDTGLVGAGMALNGANVYYTLAVKRLTGDFTYRPPLTPTSAPTLPGGTPGPTATFGPAIIALTTVTAQPDGSIQHVIRYGQTLIAIAKAYGITLEQLYAANPRLNPKNPVYYAGQKLLIRAASTLTPTASITPSLPPPTRTRVPTRTATRPPTLTATLTLTPTLGALEQTAERLGGPRRALAYLILLVSVLGLLLVFLRGFLRKK